MSEPPSFELFELPGGFHLGINSNRKMKTVLVQVSFVGNLDETVTQKALLPPILRRGTVSCPDMKAINRRLETLYGASLALHVQKNGERHLVRLRLEVVNEKFLPGETGVLRTALEFLREIIQEPLSVDGAFHPQYVEQEKDNLRLAIESLLDNKNAYAAQRLNEHMCDKEPYRFHEQGLVSDIPGIDAHSLWSLHRDWVRDYPLWVYVAGDCSIEDTRSLVEEVFSQDAFPRHGGYPLRGVPAPVPVGQPREFEERLDVNQARLHLGFRHGVTYGRPGYEALMVLNGILGAAGFPRSKLFQNVREKASLAYSVHSTLDRAKGLLFIAAGIAPENRDRARDIILQQVRALKQGEISDVEMGTAVALILNSNIMLEDNLAVLADVDLAWRLHGAVFDFQRFRDRVLAVRRDEIVEVAGLLEHDATFLLMP